MSVGVARVVRRAFVKRVPPVVVVVEGAAVVPAVLLHEGLMRVADPGVDARDDDAFASIVESRPHLRRVDRVQAPLRRAGAARGNLDRLRDRVGVSRADLPDVRARGDCVEGCRSGRLHVDRVDDPERLIADAPRIQKRTDRRLALFGERGQSLVNDLPARRAIVDPRGRTNVSLVAQDDPERGVALRRQLAQDLRLDRGSSRPTRPSARCQRGAAE